MANQTIADTTARLTEVESEIRVLKVKLAAAAASGSAVGFGIALAQLNQAITKSGVLRSQIMPRAIGDHNRAQAELNRSGARLQELIERQRAGCPAPP